MVADANTLAPRATFTVPRDGSSSTRSRLDVSACGGFVCAGNPDGVVYVFSTSAGSLVTRLAHRRIQTGVTATAISHDSRMVLFSTDGPMIFRYDYVSSAEPSATGGRTPTREKP